MLLAGDIGGTKTNLAVYDLDQDPRSPADTATFHSSEYESLETIVSEFLERVGVPLQAAVFGVAGPVVSGRAKVTNLTWVVDRIKLAKAFGWDQTYLLNDLEAIANGIPILTDQDCQVLNPGQPEKHGALAVVAPGTGLGEGFLVWNGERYEAHPSEGGHTDFGPIGLDQMALLRFLQDRFDHVSYERICSGSGLPNLYDFYRSRPDFEVPVELADRISQENDPTPIIVQEALKKDGHPVCVQALDTFVSVLGAEAGNMALKVLATGGVYLGGGIPPKILSKLREGPFLDAFRSKGRFAELMERIPVSVIMNDKIALYGAANYGLTRLSRSVR